MKKKMVVWGALMMALALSSTCYAAEAQNGQEKSEADALYELYETVNGPAAMTYLQEASALGNARATFTLGQAYLYGTGIQVDYGKALNIFLELTESGNRKAPRYVGIIYENGYGVDQDYEMAAKYYQIGAENGDITSQYYLGRCYEYGLGVEMDYEKAMEWYLQSASRGDTIAADGMRGVAGLYEQGKGVEQSQELADEWYQKAENAPEMGAPETAAESEPEEAFAGETVVSETEAPAAGEAEGGRMGGGHGGPEGGQGNRAGGQGGGQMATESDPNVLAAIEEGAEKFTQLTFEDAETGTSLEYSLYIPEDYDENIEYPLIMYIPDSTGAGKSAKEIVEQYYGADVWVTAEDQAKHASFVLVPAFSGVVVDDNWNTSEQIEAAVRLIHHLVDTYSIDTNRLYTTGQSMGCMTSLYLNSKYPDLFAASLFVSGQWDINALKGLEDKTFFYITAGGDAKASGGQDEVMAMFDADGVGYSYNTWNAQNSVEEQNQAAEELIAQGYQANMIRFETGSVLTESSGMEHMASFNYAYKIPAVRDWLFAQSK